ncbi:MAG: nucleotidyltransferase domain-containing protein [Pseudomonadales bacterium]|nr:nucleotidyltransferase domain-containing protein [Pseudomonadales bacterium]
MQAILETVCERLKAEYAAHTILLYGSTAEGSADADSDLDLAALGAVDRVIRVAEHQDGVFVDAFVYPDTALEAPEDEHLRFRGARILLQRSGTAETLLQRLEVKCEAGPEPLPEDELEMRRTWARKMVARIQRGDVEGHYQRHWLLTALLEDYFHLRALWFEGPKKTLAWLAAHDRATSKAMEAALEPGAPITAIEVAVNHVLNEVLPR